MMERGRQRGGRTVFDVGPDPRRKEVDAARDPLREHERSGKRVRCASRMPKEGEAGDPELICDLVHHARPGKEPSPLLSHVRSPPHPPPVDAHDAQAEGGRESVEQRGEVAHAAEAERDEDRVPCRGANIREGDLQASMRGAGEGEELRKAWGAQEDGVIMVRIARGRGGGGGRERGVAMQRRGRGGGGGAVGLRGGPARRVGVERPDGRLVSERAG